MDKRIMKPITVERNEFIIGITEMIKSTTLPLFVIEDILAGFYRDVKAMSDKQLQDDIKKYNAAMNGGD